MSKKKIIEEETDIETETVQNDSEDAVVEEDTAPQEEINPEIKKLNEKLNEFQDKYLRLAAEYDNFRKRSAKEKEACYSDAFAQAVSMILPIIDNIERAATFATDESDLSKGVNMLIRQTSDALAKMGVTAMESDGAEFNPEIHNAVMHEEDDSENQNIISETLQKGYMIGDKVIRHAMVKVLN